MPNSPHSDHTFRDQLKSFLLGRTEAGATFLLILGSCTAAWIGYQYLNVPVFRSTRIATVALPAGILAAALLKAPPRYRGWCAVAAVLTLALPCCSDLVTGWPWETDHWNAFAGLKFALDLVIFCVVLGWWNKRAMNPANPRHLAWLGGAAVVGITASGYAYVTAVDVILPQLTSFSDSAHSWHVAHLQVLGFILGIIIPVPALLALRASDLRPASPATFRTAAVVAGAFVAVSLVIFSQPNPAWMFLSMAAVTVITFHYELTGAALAVLATVAIVTAYDIAKLGTHVPEEDRPQILLLQLFLAVLSVTSLMMGAVLRQRRELQAELAAAKRLAEDAAAKKAAFLANMSHEIRSPLASLTLFSGLLKRAKTTRERQDIIENLHEGGQAVLDLLNRLLDFSRLEAGQVSLNPVPVDLAALIDRVIGLQLPQAQAKGLMLRLQADPEVPAGVMADAIRVRQVLLNLIGNAIKFTDHGCVTVRLGYQGGRVVITVQDTGIGIPAGHRDKLFLRFSQVDGAPGDAARGGAGLGLAITKGLVELMQGDIGVESAVGRGSTFQVSFPADPALPLQAVVPTTGTAEFPTPDPGSDTHQAICGRTSEQKRPRNPRSILAKNPSTTST